MIVFHLWNKHLFCLFKSVLFIYLASTVQINKCHCKCARIIGKVVVTGQNIQCHSKKKIQNVIWNLNQMAPDFKSQTSFRFLGNGFLKLKLWTLINMMYVLNTNGQYFCLVLTESARQMASKFKSLIRFWFCVNYYFKNKVYTDNWSVYWDVYIGYPNI